MKKFLKLLLFASALAGLIYGIYRLLGRYYPTTVRRYYSPVLRRDDSYEPY